MRRLSVPSGGSWEHGEPAAEWCRSGAGGCSSGAEWTTYVGHCCHCAHGRWSKGGCSRACFRWACVRRLDSPHCLLPIGTTVPVPPTPIDHAGLPYIPNRSYCHSNPSPSDNCIMVKSYPSQRNIDLAQCTSA